MTDDTETFATLDPIAFVVALILAPILVAALFFWAMLIPVFAVPFGGVPYLVFGTPVFLWMVTRYPVTLGRFAVGALLAHAVFILCLSIWEAAQPHPDSEFVWIFAGFGLPHSVTWGAAFAALYRTFYRPLVPGPQGH